MQKSVDDSDQRFAFAIFLQIYPKRVLFGSKGIYHFEFQQLFFQATAFTDTRQLSQKYLKNNWSQAEIDCRGGFHVQTEGGQVYFTSLTRFFFLPQTNYRQSVGFIALLHAAIAAFHKVTVTE